MPIIRTFLIGFACLLLNTAPRASAADDVPPIPETLKAGNGMIIDNYDQGNHFFTFKDKNGSTIEAGTFKHSSGPYFKYLRLTYDLKGGYVGIWSRVGMTWSDKGQDWSKAKELTFLAYTSSPVKLTFNFKLDDKRTVKAHANLDHPGKWVLVKIPTRDWENIAAGLGNVSEFNLNIDTMGTGVVAIDELRIEGAGIANQVTEKIELDPKIIFAKCLTPPAARSHKIYLVSPTGNDQSPGDAAHPFATLQHAADIVLPGDTVEIETGKYDVSTPDYHGLIISHGGAPDAWVVFKPAPGAHPFITSNTEWNTIDIRDTSYVEIRGLEITATTNPKVHHNDGNGLSGWHSHHLRFIDNTVHDCGGGGVGTAYCDYTTIDHNRTYNNAYSNIWNCSGISLWEGRDFDQKPGFHNIIQNNLSYHNENKGPTSMYGGKLTDGNGIIFDTSRGNGATLIQNNISFDNGGRGIHVFQSDNIVIRNNTVYKNGRTNGDPGVRAVACNNVLIINNIIVGLPGQNFDQDDQLGANVHYQSNIITGYKTITDPPVLADKTNRIAIDPKFVDGSIDPAKADFHLQPGSPAIGAGSKESFSPVDIDGVERKIADGIDIGAYQHH